MLNTDKMGKEFLGVRIDSKLKAELDQQAKENEETVTELTERALAGYLQVDITKPDIFDIDKRLKRLEAKFSTPQKSTPKKEKTMPQKNYEPEDWYAFNEEGIAVPVNQGSDPDSYNDLITIEQMEDITGYTRTTLSSKLSRQGIKAVDRVDGNRGGLYDKQEILERIGTK